MNVLVTGGAGFIGSHVCEALYAAGHWPLVLDNLSSRVNFTPHYCHRLVGPHQLRDLSAFAFDAVIHCAAMADIRHNWGDNGWGVWKSNVDLTHQVLAATLASKPHVILLSSCAVYGEETDEDSPLLPVSPYAASKVAAEALVHCYAAKTKAPYHNLRLTRVVGERYHHGHIADFVRQAREGMITPKSHGRDAASSVHVKDVADAVLHCLKRMAPPGAYNVGASGWSPRDTVEDMGFDPLSLDWPDDSKAWVGDVSPSVNDQKLRDTGWNRARTVMQGVDEALGFMGWRGPEERGAYMPWDLGSAVGADTLDPRW